MSNAASPILSTVELDLRRPLDFDRFLKLSKFWMLPFRNGFSGKDQRKDRISRRRVFEIRNPFSQEGYRHLLEVFAKDGSAYCVSYRPRRRSLKQEVPWTRLWVHEGAVRLEERIDDVARDVRTDAYGKDYFDLKFVSRKRRGGQRQVPLQTELHLAGKDGSLVGCGMKIVSQDLPLFGLNGGAGNLSTERGGEAFIYAVCSPHGTPWEKSYGNWCRRQKKKRSAARKDNSW